jgi:hypothetical protein
VGDRWRRTDHSSGGQDQRRQEQDDDRKGNSCRPLLPEVVNRDRAGDRAERRRDRQKAHRSDRKSGESESEEGKLESRSASPERRHHRPDSQKQTASKESQVGGPEPLFSEEQRVKLVYRAKPRIAPEEVRTFNDCRKGVREGHDGQGTHRECQGRSNSEARTALKGPGLANEGNGGSRERCGVRNAEVPLFVGIGGRLLQSVEEHDQSRTCEAAGRGHARHRQPAIENENDAKGNRDGDQQGGLYQKGQHDCDCRDCRGSHRVPSIPRAGDDEGRKQDTEYQRELQEMMVDRNQPRSIDEERRNRDSESSEESGGKTDLRGERK